MSPFTCERGVARVFLRELDPRPPEDWEQILTDLPELQFFELKPINQPEEIRIAKDLYAHRVDEYPISTIKYLRLAEAALMRYEVRLPEPTCVSRDPSMEEFLTVLSSIPRSSHPGFPFCLVASNKGDVIDKCSSELYVITRNWFRVSRKMDFRRLSRANLYDIGVSYPSLILIKDEMAKKGKNARIIEIVNIVMYIIEKLLCGDIYDARKKLKFIGYSAIGVSFDADDASKVFRKFKGEDVSTNDTPKFDTTVTETEMILHAQHCARQHGDSEICRRVHVNLEVCLSRRYLMSSDGSLLSQEHHGGQPSGRYGTSACNTFIRAMRSEAVNLANGWDGDPHISAGDDNIERAREGKLEAYQRLRIPLRDYQVMPAGKIDFCSHDWVPDAKPIAQRILKCAATVLWCEDVQLGQIFDQFVAVFGEHDRFKEIARVIMKHRWPRIEQARALDALNSKIKQMGRKKQVVRVVRKVANSNLGRGVGRLVEKEVMRAIPPFLKPIAKGITNIAKRTLTGHGDYEYNALINTKSRGLPSFGGSVTRHTRRELIGIIKSSDEIGGLKIQKFTINPALPQTCPWLANICNNYESWRPNGFVFEFVSTSGMATSSGDTSLGVVIMCCQYNVFAADPNTRVQLEGMNHAMSFAPFKNAQFGVECKKGLRGADSLLLRNSSMPSVTSPSAATLYDLGEFFIATQGFQTAGVTAGELWVTYDISLINQIVPTRQGIPQSLILQPDSNVAGQVFTEDTTIINTNPSYQSIYGKFVDSDQIQLVNLVPETNYLLTFSVTYTGPKGSGENIQITGDPSQWYSITRGGAEQRTEFPTGSNTNQGQTEQLILRAKSTNQQTWDLAFQQVGGTTTCVPARTSIRIEPVSDDYSLNNATSVPVYG